jgi:hypothetical protein
MNDNSSALSAMPDEERMEKNKQSLLAVLKSIGAKNATVTYSGGGDSGYANNVLAQSMDGTEIVLTGTAISLLSNGHIFVSGKWRENTTIKEFSLEEALAEYSMEVLGHHHLGWENNEGGEGEVVFDPVAGEARLNHNEFYVGIASKVTLL